MKSEFVNDEGAGATLLHYSDFVIPSSLVIRHSSFQSHASRTSRTLQLRLQPREVCRPLALRKRNREVASDFRISETPIFLTREFCNEVVGAANEIVAKTRTAEFARHAATAIPSGLEVPNETAHPNFLVVDFGICTVGNRLVPRLIELQAFPSCSVFNCSSSAVCAKLFRRSRETGPRPSAE
jgi:hypothetical protein